MRLWTYIKSHNETLLMGIIATIIAVPIIFLSTNNEAGIKGTNVQKNSSANDITLDKPQWTTSTTTSIDIHSYTIKFERRFTKDANNKDKILETRITLSNGGKNVFAKMSKDYDWEHFYVIGGEYNQIDSADDIKKFAIKDLNKNGVPELVFVLYSGGMHCCSKNYIIELSNPISFLLDLDTGNQFITEFKDLNHDGIMEIETYEDVFTYWNTSYGASPMPRVVLSIQDGVYKANSALMREPAPTDAVLQRKAKVIESWSGAVGPEVAWKYAIDLIYSGNISSAKKYVDLAWRNDGYGAFKTKESFWRELVDRIVQSPYFSDLSSYLGLDDIVNASVEQVCDNNMDIQKFEKPIPIVWTAKLDGCLMSCYGASFTRVPSDEKYPRFAGYYPDTAGKYNWDTDTNGNAGGSQIPEKFQKG